MRIVIDTNRFLVLLQNLLYPAHFASFQFDFDAMRVLRRFGKNTRHVALRQVAGALILLLHDADQLPGLYV